MYHGINCSYERLTSTFPLHQSEIFDRSGTVASRLLVKGVRFLDVLFFLDLGATLP